MLQIKYERIILVNCTMNEVQTMASNAGNYNIILTILRVKYVHS